MIAVADAGPLIHLNEIGALSLLNVFSAIHVPEGVWTETVAAGRVTEKELQAVAAIQRHNIERHDLDMFVQEFGLSSLHHGETECLLLCRRLSAEVLLVDDLDARDAGWKQNIRPVGSLGIVVRAFHTNRISSREAEDCIKRLYRTSSLFVTKTIADLAVEQLHGESTATDTR